MPTNPNIIPRKMMKMSQHIVYQDMRCLRRYKWKIQGQTKESRHPVKFPIKPMRIEKWGMKTAKTIVRMMIPILYASPQIFSSPSKDQIEENCVSGFPRNISCSMRSQAA